jgi:hypothetical protein
MRGGTVFLVGLATVFYVSAAYATDCEMRPSNLDGFGHFRLGQRLRTLPKGVKALPNCAVYPKYHSFDCEFTDADGNSYLASGHEMIRLERVPTASSALPLPNPLKFGMSLEDATSALAAMDPKLELTKYHSEDGDSLDTGECLKDSHGITYALTLEFDKAGRLNKLSASFETAED